MAMKTKAIAISVVVLSLAASGALAAGFTEWMQSERMTITKVDQSGKRFFCAEHQRWTASPDAATLSVGDIVSVDTLSGQPAKVRVVRTAADEMGSPE